MNNSIETALNHFYNRGIVTREQILNELLRVKFVQKAFRESIEGSVRKDKLYDEMKSTSNQFGHFPGDKDFFFEIYNECKDINITEATIEIYKNDRTGIILSNNLIPEYMGKLIQERNPKTILIAEAEKHISVLKEIIEANHKIEFTLTTQTPLMHNLLTLIFSDFSNVSGIISQSIYTDLILEEKFDYVFSVPTFGGKIDELTTEYISSQTDGVAIQTLLKVLNDSGELDIIVPARLTFASGEFADLRNYLVKHFYINKIDVLPDGAFKPYTSVKTYTLGVSKKPIDITRIRKIDIVKDSLDYVEINEIRHDELSVHTDWRLEILLSQDDGTLSRYKASKRDKVKLKDVAEIFRGKSIFKKDIQPGKIAVLNISNINDGEIDYSDLELIDDDIRKIKRYELLDRDVVLTSRGTLIKVGVFQQQSNMVIASANIIVIRPSEKVLSEYLKIFFSSPIGVAMIKSFQRGGAVMNINHSDIAEIDIPLLTICEQQRVVDWYTKDYNEYKKTVELAENRWKDTQIKIYDSIF